MKKILLIILTTIFIIGCGGASYHIFLLPEGYSDAIVSCPEEHPQWCLDTIKRICPDGYSYIDLAKRDSSYLVNDLFPALYWHNIKEPEWKKPYWSAIIACGKLDEK